MSDCSHLIPFQILIIIEISQLHCKPYSCECLYIIFVFIVISVVECRNR